MAEDGGKGKNIIQKVGKPWANASMPLIGFGVAIPAFFGNAAANAQTAAIETGSQAYLWDSVYHFSVAPMLNADTWLVGWPALANQFMATASLAIDFVAPGVGTAFNAASGFVAPAVDAVMSSTMG